MGASYDTPGRHCSRLGVARRRRRRRLEAGRRGSRRPSDQAIRKRARSRRPLVPARGGHGHRLSRPQRSRQDDDATDAARTRATRCRHGARLRASVPGARGSGTARRRSAGGGGLPPRPLGTRASDHAGARSAAAGLPRRRRARDGRADARSTPPGQDLLARDAPAARSRGGLARETRSY